jgi:TM2 domain-containing membrane protein YozV
MSSVPEQPVAPAPVASESSKSDKQKLVAFLLCLFSGGFGVHRFYLGYTTIGIIQILTVGGCGIWAIVDLVMLLIAFVSPGHGMKDADGRELS